jgi:hypothetical protein
MHFPPSFFLLFFLRFRYFPEALSNTVSVCFSLNVRDPCKTTCKIILLCILFFTLLDSQQKSERF